MGGETWIEDEKEKKEENYTEIDERRADIETTQRVRLVGLRRNFLVFFPPPVYPPTPSVA
jgi:hypothetical protein